MMVQGTLKTISFLRRKQLFRLTQFPRVVISPSISSVKLFSVNSKGNKGSEDEGFKSTLDEINKKFEEKAKEEGHSTESKSSNSPQPSFQHVLVWIRKVSAVVIENVREAYYEMIGESKESSLKRTLKQADSYKPAKQQVDVEEEEDDSKVKEPAGPSAIVLVKEGKSTWESMKERLQDSPFIREVLKNTRKIGKVAANTDIGKQAQNITQNVQDKVHDLKEFWETSQNPLVYTVSGIWDNLTGETEEGLATASLRKLDPKFSKEEWAEDVRKNLAPLMIKAQLDGDLKTLKPWLGEAVYNKLAADIRIRKADGITIDSNILHMDENAVIMKILDDDRPVIAVVYMVQQINCIRKHGEIIEGSEADIRAKFYTMVFSQIYDENTQVISWQILDYEFAGDQPYI